MHAQILSSVDELAQHAGAWNSLYEKSAATPPTLTAEHVLMWVEQFAGREEFRALVVWDEGRMLAALPLIGQKVKNLVAAGGGTFNSWSPNGDLLLDETKDVEPIMDHLAAEIDRLPWPLIWLDGVYVDSLRWQAFRRAVERRDINVEVSVKHHVGMIPTTTDWKTLEQTFSKSLVRNIGRQARNLEKLPGFQFRVETPKDPRQIQQLLTRGFEVEDRSWKGANGTSILRSPGMADFYLRQAAELAKQGCLKLLFLDCDQGPISFEYGFQAKGVFHSFKVGYDPAFRKHSPGQVLMRMMLQKSCDDREIQAVDCMGPISDALSKWRPTEHAVGRIVTAPKSLLGSALLSSYKHLRGWMKSFSL